MEEGAAVSLAGDGGGWDRTRDGAGKEDCVQAPGDRELDVPLNCPPNINTLRFPGSDTLIISLPPQGPSGGKRGGENHVFCPQKRGFTHLQTKFQRGVTFFSSITFYL